MKRYKQGILSLMLLFMIFVPLSGCGSRGKEPGTTAGVSGSYTATGQGKGEVQVTIEFKDGVVDQVKIEGKEETESIGGKAFPTLIAQLKEKNSPEIDGVSGATWTSDGVREAAKKIFEDAGVKYGK